MPSAPPPSRPPTGLDAELAPPGSIRPPPPSLRPSPLDASLLLYRRGNELPSLDELTHLMLDELASSRYAEALSLAEAVLLRDPTNEDATQCAAICRGEVRQTRPPPIDEPPISREAQRMFDRLAAGNYAGALFLAEAILTQDPTNEDATQCASMARGELRLRYIDKLGSLTHIPHHTAAILGDSDRSKQILWRMIDGRAPLEALLQRTGAAQLETLRLLFEMKLQGTIDFRAP